MPVATLIIWMTAMVCVPAIITLIIVGILRRRDDGKGERESTISPAEVNEILEKSLPAREELREALEEAFDTPPGFSTLRLKGNKKDPR